MVAVVTSFNPGSDKAVTASSLCTVLQTRIGIVSVSIVTSFKAGASFKNILAFDAIAASRQTTTVGAGIALVLITIVAGFTGVDSAVAALFKSTIRIAPIAKVCVAIITSFPSVDARIAAALDLAKTIASVARNDATIVTTFHTDLKLSVTAGC